MGLTKQYTRYEQAGVFNGVGTWSNVIVVDRGKSLVCITGAAEFVYIWNLATGEKVMTLAGERHTVTCIKESPTGNELAVGYADGTVKVFDLRTGDSSVDFSGHKSAVTTLNFDPKGMMLVSGSKDTNVIVWDLITMTGLYRLIGHAAPITCARFMKTKNYLVTSSKDTQVKFWDLDTQHCFKTMTDHQTEVYGFVFDADEARIITGSADSDLRVFGLQYDVPHDDEPSAKRKRTGDGDKEDPVEGDELTEDSIAKAEDERLIRFQKLGSISRKSNGRLVSMEICANSRILCCHGVGRKLEVFNLQTQEEVKKRAFKKVKKLTKDPNNTVCEVTVDAKDMLYPMATVNAEAKLVSCMPLARKSGKEVVVACLLADNRVQTYTLAGDKKRTTLTPWRKLQGAGHRSEVRTVAFSSDNLSMLSASGDSIKVWNRSRLQCICTLPCEYALCSTFLPGDRLVIVGTKSGKLQVYDIGASRLLESIEAHSKEVWSLCMLPNKSGLVTGSGDGEIRFWQFTTVKDEESLGMRLSLVHKRTMQKLEDVLCVKVVQSTLAAAVIDSNIHVFYADTLKRRLTLYGHKSPALSVDISSDAELLISGSADRNIKIWGLYHGNCHRSIFAHDNSIMSVQFVPETHLAFSCAKDKKIKFWDTDNFQEVTTLEGHHAEVWSVAVSPNGKYVMSCSADKTVRLWHRTEEPLVLEEEQEKAREKEYEDAVTSQENAKVPGEAVATEADLAGRRTIGSVKGTEMVAESIELYREESAKETAGETTPLHPLLRAYNLESADMYVLLVLQKIKSSDLENSLLGLPFSYVLDLMGLLEQFINRGLHIEVATRCYFFLARIHHQTITSSGSFLPLLEKVAVSIPAKMRELKDMVGFNIAGLNVLKQMVEEKQEVRLFDDALTEKKVKAKKRKKEHTLVTVR